MVNIKSKYEIVYSTKTNNIKRFIDKIVIEAHEGNENYGEIYCNALNILHEKLNVEIVMTFELAGNKFDVELFLKKYNEIEKLNY